MPIHPHKGGIYSQVYQPQFSIFLFFSPVRVMHGCHATSVSQKGNTIRRTMDRCASTEQKSSITRSILTHLMVGPAGWTLFEVLRKVVFFILFYSTFLRLPFRVGPQKNHAYLISLKYCTQQDPTWLSRGECSGMAEGGIAGGNNREGMPREGITERNNRGK